jgi:predicted MFS family arabinose efflux permease
MFTRRFKTGYFVLEGLNSFATVYYFYYFYFFMQKEFEFGNRANLALAALNGGTYAVFAWAAGKFAQRFGYFIALKLGFGLMMGSLICGLFLATSTGHILVMVSAVIGMCFTWPTLEALVSEGEPRGGLQQMVGVYNVVWAATAAAASFTGGAMLEKLGLRSLFYVPIAIQACQLALTLALERNAAGKARTETPKPGKAGSAHAPGERPPSNAGKFLRMAWLANPFGYIAINTLIAAMPGVASRLGLSTMLAGFCGSVWCFARGGAFLLLWCWPGWHYRFRWLLFAYLGLIGTFAAILLAPSVAVLVSAQIIFGASLGVLYYSSLFYSMDSSDTKGEHGGIHEAVIGLGNFAGPATGAAALYLVPRYANSGTLAVSVLLLCGLAGLTVIWGRGEKGGSRGEMGREKGD